VNEESKDRIIQDFATNIIRLGNECRDHALEVKRLKDELTDLKSTADQFKIENSILIKEINRLLVEVDSLTTNPTSRLLRAEREENARLKAEVERLTKAGDEMALNLTHIGWNICVEAWNAAKEGKQS